MCLCVCLCQHLSASNHPNQGASANTGRPSAELIGCTPFASLCAWFQVTFSPVMQFVYPPLVTIYSCLMTIICARHRERKRTRDMLCARATSRVLRGTRTRFFEKQSRSFLQPQAGAACIIGSVGATVLYLKYSAMSRSAADATNVTTGAILNMGARARTRAHAHTRAHTRTHTRTHAHTRTHTRTHAHTHAHTRTTHAHTRAHTRTGADTDASIAINALVNEVRTRMCYMLCVIFVLHVVCDVCHMLCVICVTCCV